MDKKSINELRRRLKKDSCSFTKVCGCYVNDKKEKVTEIDESFIALEDDLYFKFLEISKKVLSTNLGNNLLELPFLIEEEKEGGRQEFLMRLKKSALKDKSLLDSFYDMIIEKYDSLGNYLILLFHDVYDVPTKTSDGMKLDESEEVYEYIICCICPMILSKPGLGYNKDTNLIGTLNREWMVGMPETGFIFPAFNDRGSDIHCVHMYCANPKEVHNEMIEDIFGCSKKLTLTQKQNVLTSMVEEVTDAEALSDIMESVNIELAKVSSMEPDTYINSEHVADALECVGIGSSKAEEISRDYIENIKEPYEEQSLPLLSDMISNKAIKAVKDNNEKILLKEEIKDLNRKLSEMEADGEDIIIKVNSSKIDMIRREEINGQNCVVIPILENENVKIN